MIDQRTMELTHLVLDGEANAEEVQELQAAREGSPELDALYRETEELAALLEKSARDVPPGLAEGVLARLKAERAHRDPGPVLSFPRRRWLVAALAAAAGIVVLLTLVPIIDSRFPVDRNGVSGALQPVDFMSWPEIARVESPAAEVELVLRRRDESIAVIPLARGSVKGSVRVRWDAGQLELVEILSEVRNDAPYTDRGEAIFIAGEMAPVFVLRPVAGAAGRTRISMFLGNQRVATAEIRVN